MVSPWLYISHNKEFNKKQAVFLIPQFVCLLGCMVVVGTELNVYDNIYGSAAEADN